MATANLWEFINRKQTNKNVLEKRKERNRKISISLYGLGSCSGSLPKSSSAICNFTDNEMRMKAKVLFGSYVG